MYYHNNILCYFLKYLRVLCEFSGTRVWQSFSWPVKLPIFFLISVFFSCKPHRTLTQVNKHEERINAEEQAVEREGSLADGGRL